MSAIATKIVEKYNLTPKMSVVELSQHTSEFLENLTDDKKRNQARRRLQDGFKFSSDQVDVLIPNQRGEKSKTINIIKGNCRIAIVSPPKDLEEEIIRKITKRILQNRYGFSKYQVNTLFSTQKNEKKETIGDMAQQVLRDKLSIRDVRAKAYALALSALNVNAGSSRLSWLRRELRNLNASLEIIEATKFPDITKDANEIQNNRREKVRRIDYPDHFTLKSVKERLDTYDISTLPNYQTLADVMLMLCIRPAELTTLRITNVGVTCISGTKWFNRFLKEYDLIPKYLRKIGAVYGAVVHKADSTARTMTIAGECLKHDPYNFTSPVQNYIIVNYRKKGQTAEQARPFHLYDDNN
ncbi:hypothetical protein Glove_117g523 [Diversispora epigaea]|uniref:Uncharacterized protein n=1 Tax=Diversispora epigaea TaxID=1348612 RepID=A0A397J560_9GLOM|nr:hypothetical protein Glove_117g523 [Diversispora epigaea]